MLRQRSTLALLGLVLLAIGCSAAEPGPRTRTPSAASSRKPHRAAQPGSDVINGLCPITGRSVAPHAPTIAYKGGTIGFCSETCVAEWKRLGEPIQDNFVAMTVGR